MEMQIAVYFLASPLKSCVCVCNKLREMGALLEGTRVAHVTYEARVKNSAKEDWSLNIQDAWHGNTSLRITMPPQSITLVR